MKLTKEELKYLIDAVQQDLSSYLDVNKKSKYSEMITNLLDKLEKIERNNQEKDFGTTMVG